MATIIEELPQGVASFHSDPTHRVDNEYTSLSYQQQVFARWRKYAVQIQDMSYPLTSVCPSCSPTTGASVADQDHPNSDPNYRFDAAPDLAVILLYFLFNRCQNILIVFL
jgi:hypothetical protein